MGIRQITSRQPFRFLIGTLIGLLTLVPILALIFHDTVSHLFWFSRDQLRYDTRGGSVVVDLSGEDLDFEVLAGRGKLGLQWIFLVQPNVQSTHEFDFNVDRMRKEVRYPKHQGCRLVKKFGEVWQLSGVPTEGHPVTEAECFARNNPNISYFAVVRDGSVVTAAGCNSSMDVCFGESIYENTYLQIGNIPRAGILSLARIEVRLQTLLANRFRFKLENKP